MNKDKLFKSNMALIAKMDTAAGSTVKGFLKGIERNGGCYVELSSPEKKRVEYKLLEGEQTDLTIVAEVMGIGLTATHIEAYSK